MFCEGGHFVLVPSHCAQIFNSSKKGVQMFSYLISAFAFSSLSGSFVSTFILNKAQEYEMDGYSIIFSLSSVMNASALIILFSYNNLLNSQKDPNNFERMVETTVKIVA